MRELPVLILALVAAAPAAASSPDAWAAGDRASAQACVAASGLKNASALPQRARWPDTLGYDAILIRGTWPQPHMKGAKGTMLCLWHRGWQRAFVTEADGWTVAP